MFRLTRFLKPYLGLLALVVVFVSVQAWSTLALPTYMANIVNQGIVFQDNHYILTTGGKMLIVSLVSGIATISVGYLASRIAIGTARDLRRSVFTKVESFALAEFDKFSTASLITRTTNDITQVQTVLFMLMRLVLMAPILAIGGIIKAYNLAPSMSWIMAVAVGALLVTIISLFAVALPKFQLLQKLVDRLNLVTRQNLTGLRVIRAFNNEQLEEKRFDVANSELTRVNLFVNRLMAIMGPMMTLIMNFSTIAVIWFGAHLVNSGSLQIGNMIAFLQYAMQVIFSFLMISIVFILVPRASVSAGRINEVLSTPSTIIDPEKSTHPEGVGKVEFKNVTFSYPKADTPVISNINFIALPGETTALIGSTGSGKSTIVNLIPRFYDVTTGEILVDGIDIRQYSQHQLHDKIGFVPQKGVLFSGTIKDNIKYGAPQASDESVKEAAEIAQASEFIEGLEGGYNAPIAQGGSNVSGGQKQRLSIARAIVKEPEIYIFDDSFSALDYKTDAKLRQALAPLTHNKTVIIVAQRISTIMHADKIIVLNEGNVVGIGKHHDLLRNCKVYQEIASSQLSEKELADSDKTAPARLAAKGAL